MEGKEDVYDFIQSFGGSNRYILDLLGEEVLAGLPAAQREFMLKTSVLAESIPYESRLPDGSISVESETTIIRAIFGNGGVKSMVAAAVRSAELEAEQDAPWRLALVKMASRRLERLLRG